MKNALLALRGSGRMKSAVVKIGMLIALFAAGSIAIADDQDDQDEGSKQWPMGGQNYRNTRSQDKQKVLHPGNAGRLALKWSQTVAGSVSATPAIVGGAIYFPDWGGYLNKLDARTGRFLWRKRIDSYAGEPAGAVSRTSPAVVDDVVYIGDQNGAHLLAIEAETGNLKWSSVISEGPLAIITQSPVVYRGVVYVGVASTEEGVAANPSYPCCRFQGSFSAVDARTGAIKWTTKTVPDNGGAVGGYSGGAIWSSTPAIDKGTNTIFITTGNNYAVPASVKACQENGGTPTQCMSPENRIDSIIALDMATGRIKWSTGTKGFDDWTVACLRGPSGSGNCPPMAGPDFDFGSGANLFTMKDADGKERVVVGAGQKSGIYWLLNADDGTIRWPTRVVPGSVVGGILWGTATDGKRIYVAGSNRDLIPYTVNGASVVTGSFAALDPATGNILWQTLNPSGSLFNFGAVSVSNGVMLAGSMNGHMYAFDAETGTILWDYPGEGSSNAGPSIGSDGTVYWGNGYTRLGLGTGSFTFYAFSIDGK